MLTTFSPLDAIDAFASLPVRRSALHEEHLRQIAEENAANEIHQQYEQGLARKQEA